MEDPFVVSTKIKDPFVNNPRIGDVIMEDNGDLPWEDNLPMRSSS